MALNLIGEDPTEILAESPLMLKARKGIVRHTQLDF